MRNFTDITFILDRSGSMDSLQSDVIGGFRAFVEEQQRLGDNAALTLVQFDHEYAINFSNVPIKDVSSTIEFIPRGATALLDAIGRTIVDTGIRLSQTPEADRPNKVLMIVMTDGHENASIEFTGAKIREMVEHQKTVYQWEFVFLGANIDSFGTASSLGVSSFSVSNYDASSHGTKSALRGVSTYTASLRSSAGGGSAVSMAEAYAKSMDAIKRETAGSGGQAPPPNGGAA